MRLINLDDVLKPFPKADFDGDALENMKAYPHWKTDITGLFNILKSVPIIDACEDCISRQRVLNDLENVSKGNEHPRQAFVFVDECVDYITSVPSVKPTRPHKGVWIPIYLNNIEWGYKCSNCKETWLNEYNYCPECGCKMEVKDEN